MVVDLWQWILCGSSGVCLRLKQTPTLPTRTTPAPTVTTVGSLGFSQTASAISVERQQLMESSDHQPPTNRVMLWTVPRGMSSAFERAVRELEDVKVLYEPYFGSFCYGPERKLYSSLDPDIEKNFTAYTYDYADKMLLASYSNFSAVFAKSMAHHVSEENYEMYTQGKFTVYKHTFLIRNPHLSIPSLWRLCKRNGIEFPGLETKAYHNLFKLYECIRSKTDKEVIVVDACNLLQDPGAILSQYCQKTGLIYSDKMLTWKPGIVEDWTECPAYMEWHSGAMFSSGFGKGLKKSEQVEETFPPEVEEEIEKAMPYYEAMHKHCIKAP